MSDQIPYFKYQLRIESSGTINTIIISNSQLIPHKQQKTHTYKQKCVCKSLY